MIFAQGIRKRFLIPCCLSGQQFSKSSNLLRCYSVLNGNNSTKNSPPVIKTEGFIYYSSLLLYVASASAQHRDLCRFSRPLNPNTGQSREPPVFFTGGVKRQPCPLTPVTALQRPWRPANRNKQHLTHRPFRCRILLAVRLLKLPAGSLRAALAILARRLTSSGRTYAAFCGNDCRYRHSASFLSATPGQACG